MCVLRIAVLLIARVAAALGCCVVSVGYSLVVRGGEKQTKGLSPDGTPMRLMMNQSIKQMILSAFVIFQMVAMCSQSLGSDKEMFDSDNWPGFLAQHDMVWDRVPNRWELSPFTGNGNVGFLFYQAEDDAKNVISIFTGRHDYCDHRLPHEGNENLWIYRSRLPLGRFQASVEGRYSIGRFAFKPVECGVDWNNSDRPRVIQGARTGTQSS